MKTPTESNNSLPWIGAGAALIGLAGLVLPKLIGSRPAHEPSELSTPVRASDEDGPREPTLDPLNWRSDETAVETSSSNDPSFESASRPDSEIDIDRLDAALATIKDSFQTENPNFEELSSLALILARGAAVDENSIKRDNWNVVRGELMFKDTDIRGTFSVSPDGQYEVVIGEAETQSDSPFLFNQVILAFQGSEGRITGNATAVQFSPNTSKPASSFLNAGEERLVGWTGTVQDDLSTSEQPISMRAAENGDGWIIGHATNWKERRSHSADTHAHSAFFSLLSGFQD